MTVQTNRPRVAVLDDDADVRRLLGVVLKRDYEVLTPPNGTELRRLVDNHEVDAIVLDIGLPNEDGIAIARQIRSTSSVPLVFLSGYSSEDMIVKGLNIGGDDYVTKPFQAEVLLARLRNALRRVTEVPSPSLPTEIRSGDVTFELRQQRLANSDGRSVKLTGMEAELLYVLVRADGETLSRDEIFRRIHGRDWDPFDRSLEVHLSHLRKKLAQVSNIEIPIIGIRGVGYRLNVELTDRTEPAE